jgi:hypothetical protein
MTNDLKKVKRQFYIDKLTTIPPGTAVVDITSIPPLNLAATDAASKKIKLVLYYVCSLEVALMIIELNHME